MPVTRRPGRASSSEKRMIRRSNGARVDLRGILREPSCAVGLEPILFHPPVEGAAAQAKRFGCLAHVALKALQRFANQNAFNRLEAQFFQVLRGCALTSQTEVGR